MTIEPGRFGHGNAWRTLARAFTAACLLCGAGVHAAPVAPRSIFALNSLDATISVIDRSRFTKIRRVPTGKEPHHLYLSPDEKSLLVANALGDSVTMIDPSTGDVQRVI